MKPNRPALRIAIAVPCLLVLSGCAQAADSAGPTQSAAPITDPTQSLDGVKLTFWAAETSVNVPSQVVEEFERVTGADVNVVVLPGIYEQAVPTKLATGDRPDLMFWQPTVASLNSIQAGNIAQPLTDEAWTADLSPGVAEIGVVDGERLAAVVTAPSSIGIFYNKEVFERAGVEPNPQGFDELIEIAEQIKEIGVEPFYEVGEDNWPLQWIPSMLLAETTQTGDFWPLLNINDGKSWSSPEIVGAIEKYQTIFEKDLAQEGYLTGTFEEQGEFLYSGQVGMSAQLGALIAQLKAKYSPEAIDERIGFFPVSSDGDTGTWIVDQTNGVIAPRTGDAKREEAARQLLAFWLGPNYEAFIDAGNLISIQPAVASPESVAEVEQTNAAAVEGGAGAFQTQSLVICDSVTSYLQSMLYGRMSPQDVGDSCAADVQRVAQAQGLPGF